LKLLQLYLKSPKYQWILFFELLEGLHSDIPHRFSDIMQIPLSRVIGSKDVIDAFVFFHGTGYSHGRKCLNWVDIICGPVPPCSIFVFFLSPRQRLLLSFVLFSSCFLMFCQFHGIEHCLSPSLYFLLSALLCQLYHLELCLFLLALCDRVVYFHHEAG